MCETVSVMYYCIRRLIAGSQHSKIISEDFRFTYCYGLLLQDKKNPCHRAEPLDVGAQKAGILKCKVFEKTCFKKKKVLYCILLGPVLLSLINLFNVDFGLEKGIRIIILYASCFADTGSALG